MKDKKPMFFFWGKFTWWRCKDLEIGHMWNEYEKTNLLLANSWVWDPTPFVWQFRMQNELDSTKNQRYPRATPCRTIVFVWVLFYCCFLLLIVNVACLENRFCEKTFQVQFELEHVGNSQKAKHGFILRTKIKLASVCTTK